MANTINWGKIYESTYWGNTDNNISWGKAYADLAGVVPALVSEFVSRVEADGGSVESTECMSTDLTFLVNNPEPVDFTGLLNDYSGAAAAYSLRLLDNTYSGNAIKVRRSSDNAEQDIAFVNNELDTASLETFAGSGDAFVTTWYDQSGNGNDATQTTASKQPKIVSSGSTILENGKAAVELTTASNQYMNLSNIGFSSGITNFNVLKPNTSPIFWQYIYIYDGVSNVYGISFSDSAAYDHRNILMGTKALSNDSISADFTQQLLSAYYDGSGDSTTDGTMHIDSVNAPLNASRVWGAVQGASLLGSYPAGSSSNYFKGKIQEVILYDSDQSSNRTGIETNINDFYSIY